MVLGTPVAITMFGASLAYILCEPGLSLANVATKVISGVSGSSLLSLPLFILAGEIMNSSGITDRLFDFPLAFVGHFRGGLAHVNVLDSVLFAGMSGSSIADTAGMGKVEIEMMRKEGYDTGFAAGITAAASTIGPIIPPSNTMIVYAVLAEVSVARLFVGGVVPGLVMAILLMIYIAAVAKKKNLPRRPKADGKERWRAFKAALFPILTPVILIAGLTFGIMTANEAGAVAVVYASILDICYNGISLARWKENFQKAMVTLSQISFIVIASALFGWVVTYAQLPNMMANFLYNLGAQKWFILLLMNVIMLIMGCFLSINATLMIITPMFVALAQMYGIDLVHLGVIITLNLTIGTLTPPVGWNLYILQGITGLPFEKVVRAVMPFLIMLLISLLLITYIDQLVMWLPSLMMG